MLRQTIALAVAFGLVTQDAAFASQNPTLDARRVQIAWEELVALVVDQRISTTLPDGTRLEGDALAVRPEALVVDVQKTSNKKLHPKGQTEIPRSAVSEVRVIRVRGIAMRIILGILGGFGGAYASVGLAFVTDSAAVLLPAILLGIPLAAIGGYYAGKLLDTRVTHLLIKNPGQPGGFEEDGHEIQ